MMSNLSEFDEYTGFESDEVLNKNEYEVVNEIFNRRDVYRSLIEHPGWKFLDLELRSALEAWINLLKKSDNIEEIRKIQAFISVFELFPVIIEKAFLDAESISAKLTQYIGESTPNR